MKKAKTKNERKGQHIRVCNMYGEDCLVYTIQNNAPICNDCFPIKSKKLMSENQMLRTILNAKEETKLDVDERE